MWERVSHAAPGQTYLVDLANGGYSERFGWTGDSGDMPGVVPVGDEAPDANDADKETFISKWVELGCHLEDVTQQACRLAAALQLNADAAAPLVEAARWHDVGKAHPCFQQMLMSTGATLVPGKLWAKSASQQGRCDRKGFRHELASALAWLQHSADGGSARNMVAYLIAAHHGRVRLSIRSFPGENPPPEDGRLFARGIWQGDQLPTVSLGTDESISPVELDLSFMQMGGGPKGESWLARMLYLRDNADIGPFRLAYLETLLRVADWRASELEKQPQ